MRSDWALAALVAFALVAGCLDDGRRGTEPTPTAEPTPPGVVHIDLPAEPGPGVATFALYTLPAVYQDPIGLYEPTIDVAGDGAIYVSAHSTEVGRNPAPAYYSLDDGATWQSMALLLDQQGEPDQQMSAPLLSDEVFIIAAEDGMAWGMDCCVQAHAPLVGWCQNGAEACYYNQNAYASQGNAVGGATCQAFPLTDRPWLAYNNGKLLLVNNPGGGPLQVGSMDVPPLLPLGYTGASWGIDWNLCASSDGYIPGIPDMRADHFFAVPQLQDWGGCGDSHYDVMTGNANDMADIKQTTWFANSHAPPAESDSSKSQVGHYGQTAFDADGALYLAAMNNTSASCEDGEREATPDDGGLHVAFSTDDGASFTETSFRFDAPVSSFYMDGNRQGPGVLASWGLIDGAHTDWYIGHLRPNGDGSLRLDNVMLAVNDGPEASRHVQGAALGPDGRAYLALSMNSQNPGGATSEPGDTPLRVAVQQDGPTLGP